MRYLRFTLWAIAVFITSVGQAIWIARGRSDSSLFYCIIIALLLMVVLLTTTPNDAIKLPRWVSEIAIVVIMIGLLILAGGSYSIARLAVTAALLIVLRVMDKSPWWAVPVAWLAIY